MYITILYNILKIKKMYKKRIKKKNERGEIIKFIIIWYIIYFMYDNRGELLFEQIKFLGKIINQT